MINRSECVEKVPQECMTWYYYKKIGLPRIHQSKCPRWVTKYKHRGQTLARVIFQKHHGIELEEGQQVNHSCGNSLCLNINHLYSGNQRQNMRERAKHGTSNKGKTWVIPRENRHHFKLSLEIYSEIRSAYESGKHTQRDLAKMYNVSQPRINMILKNPIYQKTLETPAHSTPLAHP